MSEQPKVEFKPFLFGEAATSTGAFVFQPAAPAAAAETSEETSEISDEQAKEEAERDAGVYFEPVCHLETIQTSNNEENEEVIFKMRSKLYRFDKKENEWKERGLGDVRLMQHKETHKIRILMRQEKTLKVRLNHYVVPGLELNEMPGSDTAWMWNCPMDYADEEPQPEIFAIRFKTHEFALSFKEAFEDAMQKNAALMTPKKEEEEKKEEEGEKKEEEK